MKIIYKGNVFNPTGMATVNREIIKSLVKLGHQVQTDDIWHDTYEFNKGLEFLNNPINPKDAITIFSDYPQYWRGGFGKLIGHFVHEGTRLFPDWAGYLNKVEKLWVPSNATKNLFRWNDVTVPIKVIPHGINNLYKPKESKNDEFLFLSVNSWTGMPGDRKGTDLLIRAFNEEFKQDEPVKLLLKISTFWRRGINFMEAVMNITKKPNKNILFNDAYVPEKELVKYYQKADCFVSPTRGEAFGLTILNAMACGLPVLVTKDINSGHMDFCRDYAYWIETSGVCDGDPTFYFPGNKLAEPDLEDLKAKMRWMYENKDKIRKRGLKSSSYVRKNFSWDKTAKEILNWAND